MSKYALILFFLVMFTASDTYAFFDYAGDKGSFKARLAVDMISGYNVYPEPELLYPKKGEGVNSVNFRLLCDATWGDWARLEFNGYQLTRTRQHSALDLEEKDEPYRSVRLRGTLSDREDFKALTGLDQASLKLYAEKLEVVVGRQPIGLANNFIFTPNDLFYPFSATAVDREFRPGVDALRLDVKTGELSGWSLITVMGYNSDNRPEWDRSAALLKGNVNFNGVEYNALGGKADGRYMAGLAVSAQALGLGWRMEGNYSHPSTHTQDPYIQISAGFDKRWPNTFHLILEYYYHGNGQHSPADYLSRLANPQLILDPFLGRNYLGLTLMGDPSPLFNLQMVTLVNLDDGSNLFSPAIIYKAADEIEFILSFTLTVGKKSEATGSGISVGSEYGLYPISTMLQGRIYF